MSDFKIISRRYQSMNARKYYLLCGWRVSSAFPLPELPIWDGDDRGTDVSIEVNAKFDSFAHTADMPKPISVDLEGSCHFLIKDVAGYSIDRKGERVTIFPQPLAAEADIRLYLLGVALGILCYRRGLLPLHAGCVRIGDRVIALAGPSGIGKSTLTAALMQLGHSVLADDVTAVDVFAPGGPQVWPTFPKLRLCPDAITRLGLRPANPAPGRVGADKHEVAINASFCSRPSPLYAIFHLERGDGRADGPRLISGAQATARLGRDLYRPGLLARLGVAAQALAGMAALRHLPGGAWIINQGREIGGLERCAADILARVGDGSARAQT